MTNASIKDADVSVLTIPREDPPPTRRPGSWLRWLTAGIAAGFFLVSLYWYLSNSSTLPEVDTAPVRLTGRQAFMSPLCAGYTGEV